MLEGGSGVGVTDELTGEPHAIAKRLAEIDAAHARQDRDLCVALINELYAYLDALS